MYKVLLVEDEPIVRLALKSLVQWEKYDFDMELEASNGKKALDIINSNMDVDIIIADINMPVMNGLEFIGEVNKMNIDPTIIVLSAYDDYKLVREAFKLGIYDYILKTEMEPDKILKLLLKVVHEKKHLKEKTYSNVYTANHKKDFLKNLLYGEKILQVETQVQAHGLRFEQQNLSVSFLLIDNFKKIKERYEDDTLKSLMNSVTYSIYQVLSEMNKGEVIGLSPEEYVLILSVNNFSQSFIRHKIDEILQIIRHSLCNYLNIEITVGVSGILNGYNNLPRLYKQAERNARLRYVLGKGKNIYPEDAAYLRSFYGKNTIEKDKELVSKTSNVSSCELDKLHSLIGREKGLLEALDLLDKHKCCDELEKIVQLIETFKAERIEEVYTYYLEVVFIIVHYIIDSDEDYKNIFQNNIDFYEIISGFETKDEIDNWIRELLDKLLKYLIDGKSETSSLLIRKAKQFIKENHMKRISLEMVSEYVGVSEGYLCKTFNKEEGETFMSYVTRVRIEKAKELLRNTNKKIYEICNDIGYVNVEHFSRTFKKITGLSPKQYKNKV